MLRIKRSVVPVLTVVLTGPGSTHIFFFFLFFLKPATCHDIAPAVFKTAAHLYHYLLFIIVYAQISRSYFGMKSLCIQVVKYDTFSY